MNLRLTLVATVAGAVCVGSAYGVDPRIGNGRPTTPTYTQPAFDLPLDRSFNSDPFQPRNPNNGAGTYLDGRRRFDLVSFPGGGVTPGTPLIGNPTPLIANPQQPDTRVAPSVNPGANKNRWRIGVYTRNTPTGVLIVRPPVPNSPAELARLEANDVIVAVGGYQVGLVNGERHDLGTEFDLRCDENGATTLLVQNHRDRTLVNIPVQLEPRFATVTGEIVWRSQYALPREAHAIIELRERVRQGAPVVTIAQTEVYDLVSLQESQTGKVPFALEYSQSDIDPNREYFVVSTIVDGYNTLYTSERGYPVITGQSPRTAKMQLTQVWDWIRHSSVADNSQVNDFEQFRVLFQKYMGRPLYEYEADLYRNDFNHGKSLEDALANVMGGQEFYTRSQNDDRQFIIKAHQMYTGQMPSEQQIQYWISRLREYNGLRGDFTRDFISNLN